LSRISGRIDHLGLPVVRLETPTRESFLALVDSGFNGHLMLAEQDARSLGFQVHATEIDASLAGNIVEKMTGGRGTIMWMGAPHSIELIVSPNKPVLRRDDDPVALIGTALLTPHLLLIDFAANTVEIEAQRPGSA
jgi:predicted aspartyl protease